MNLEHLKPLMLVGKNRSGKTHTLINMTKENNGFYIVPCLDIGKNFYHILPKKQIKSFRQLIKGRLRGFTNPLYIDEGNIFMEMVGCKDLDTLKKMFPTLQAISSLTK